MNVNRNQLTKTTDKNKKTSMNEYRNQFWRNSYNCRFLVSMEKKTYTGRNLPKKVKKASVNINRNQLSWISYDYRFLVSSKTYGKRFTKKVSRKCPVYNFRLCRRINEIHVCFPLQKMKVIQTIKITVMFWWCSS